MIASNLTSDLTVTVLRMSKSFSSCVGGFAAWKLCVPWLLNACVTGGILLQFKRLHHFVCRNTDNFHGGEILSLPQVKTWHLHKQTMGRHRKWFMQQLAVSGFVLWNRFVIRVASSAYPLSHPARTWDSISLDTSGLATLRCAALVCKLSTVMEPEGRTSLLPKPAIRQEPESVSSNSHVQNSVAFLLPVILPWLSS